ncbi:unnamed protein product [Effrenium voratum]|uniref:BTB domain-containing protein n=1 Tax=Effrenium voratum TaxID=2562239 RepID=A0AA36J181_9DINO|nr:unnamed protein product [Effrenium voratum]CAJ1428867.1 unnamed protein product [Effrenium voratum]
MAEEPEAVKPAEPVALSVPADLNLLHFLGRDELCDCTIRMPGTELRCHRLALCSCSGFFFRGFLASGAPDVLDLPELPEDAELRRQLPVRRLFQQVLRFAYAGQRWEALEADETSPAPDCCGLLALALVLEAPALREAAYGALVPEPGTATKLLYVATLLQSRFEGFRPFLESCQQQVLEGFGVLDAAQKGLLAKLPVDLLVYLLEQDALNVPDEGTVLRFVRHVLWRRLARPAMAQLAVSGTGVAQPAEGQLLWESLALEEPGFAPPVPRFSAAALGEGAAIPELTHRLPEVPGRVMLRALREDEVVALAEVPIRRPQEPGAAVDLQVQAAGVDGQPVGMLQVRYTLSEAQEPEAPEPAAPEGAAPEAPEAEAEAPKEVVPDQLLTEEEARRLLGAVRFSQLEHQQLLEAVKDPLLAQAGAQPLLLEALSTRLARYEAVDGVEAIEAAARPSTRGRAREPSAEPAEPEPAVPPAPEAPAPPELPAPQSPAATMTLGRGTGTVLFPCACGEGRMQLRQAEGRWLAKCNRLASCGRVLWLPTSVMGAAVDGHCAVCALRLGGEVRTLTVRLSRDQLRALRKLPQGVDTMRGLCVAGCNDMLSLLA